MPGKLHFDVTASGRDASAEFAAIASQLQALEQRLDRIDGKNVKAKVGVDTASTAPLTALQAHLDRIDGRVAKARVEVDVDKGIGDRLTSVANGITKLGSISSAAASGMTRFRSVAQDLVNPAQIPVIASLSDAIENKFHSAVEKARVGVEKLDVGMKAIHTSLLALGGVGAGVQAIGGLVTSLVDLSGAALLIPATVGAAAVAVGTAKIAFANFWDAVNADTPKKFTKATEDMSKSALATVLVLRDLKSALSGVGSVGSVIQANMFAGLAEQVKTLGSVYLPILRTGLGETATLFNGMAQSTLKWATSLQTTAQVRQVIDNTNVALRTMRDTVTNAASGFLTLATAGSAWLPRMAAAIDGASAKFAAWSQRIVADGSFDRWVTNAVTAFKQLGTILGNIGSIAGTVFSALNGNGAGFLATLAAMTTQMRAFLATTQGASALAGLAQTMSAVGDAMQRVLMAALRELGPLMTALAPAATALAVALGDNLVHVIELAGPVLTSFATALSAHPALLTALAHAATLVVIGFTPMVAIIGVVATVLKGMLIASLAGAALSALGLQGTVAARVLMALVSPMALIREAMPLIARAVGALGAQLAFMAGPIGVVIVAFAALYASSSQFRDAMNGIASTIGSLFMRAVEQAGVVLNGTVQMIGDLATAFGQATSGIASFGSSVLSVFGPLGQLVEDVLVGIFDHLSVLPGAALAAFAAFKVLGLIAPLFATASAAAAAFSARMLALQASTAIGAAGATAVGVASGKLATALGKVGGALPLVGVAVVALGAVYSQFASIADEVAQNVVNGSMSMSAAISAEFERLNSNVIFGVSQQQIMSDAIDNVRGRTEAWLATLGPLDQAQARVRISQQNLTDEILKYGPGSREAAAAAQVLARDEADLAAKQKTVADATRDTTAAMKAQTDQMSSQIGTALAYSEAVERTAEAQKTANDALKKNGADSKEYADAVKALTQDMRTQIDAARAQAEALGGTAAGVQAYNTEILRAADLSTQAGRDAFVKLVSGLDRAGLAAITTAAEMSGLRTEIVTLPDGRTVKVVVEADRAKLDSVRQGVEDLAARKYVGTVEILGNTDLAQGAILQTVRLADGTKATIKINADGSPAILTVGQTKYTIDSTTGTLKVLGDVAPGEASLAGFKVKVDTTTGLMTLDANPLPADAQTAGAKARMDTSIGTITIDGNPTLANGKTTASVTFANGQKGTITIDGNEKPANGKITATVTYANGQKGIIQVDANDALARSSVAGTVAWIKNQNASITVDVIYSGSSPAAVRAAGSGGLVMGTPGGRVQRFAGGGVLSGYAPGRDTELAMLAKGESVLVPELTRTLGAARIMDANREASGGRPGNAVGSIAAMMDGSIRGGGGSAVASVTDIRRGAGGGATAAQAATSAGLISLAAGVSQMRGDLQAVASEIRKQRPFVVEDHSGNPVETARATALALAIA